MAVTKDDVERWHRNVSRATGMMSSSLARGKRSPTMIGDVIKILEEATRDMKDKNNED